MEKAQETWSRMLVAIRPSRYWCTYATGPAAISSRKTIRRLPPTKLAKLERMAIGSVLGLEAGEGLGSDAVEVVEARPRVELALEHEHALVLEHVADLARRIAQVAELARADRADL